jgi:hypothetical protein
VSNSKSICGVADNINIEDITTNKEQEVLEELLPYFPLI